MKISPDTIKNILSNEYYLLVGFIIVWVAYIKNKHFGLYICFAAFVSLFYLKSNDNYSWKTMLKFLIIIISSIVIFLTTTKKIKPYLFNNTITNLVKLNLICLIFSINDVLVWFGLIFIVLTMPTFIYRNNNIQTKSKLINTNIWVIIQTIVLYIYYTNNIYFYNSKNYYFVLLAILLPLLIQFYTNKWLESRALFLCFITIIDSYN